MLGGLASCLDRAAGLPACAPSRRPRARPCSPAPPRALRTTRHETSPPAQPRAPGPLLLARRLGTERPPPGSPPGRPGTHSESPGVSEGRVVGARGSRLRSDALRLLPPRARPRAAGDGGLNIILEAEKRPRKTYGQDTAPLLVR